VREKASVCIKKKKSKKKRYDFVWFLVWGNDTGCIQRKKTKKNTTSCGFWCGETTRVAFRKKNQKKRRYDFVLFLEWGNDTIALKRKKNNKNNIHFLPSQWHVVFSGVWKRQRDIELTENKKKGNDN
jgi:hypothetical protein